jgi:hypothetical protein
MLLFFKNIENKLAAGVNIRKSAIYTTGRGI